MTGLSVIKQMIQTVGPVSQFGCSAVCHLLVWDGLEKIIPHASPHAKIVGMDFGA